MSNLDGEIKEQLQVSFAKCSAHFDEGETATISIWLCWWCHLVLFPATGKPEDAAVNMWNTHLKQTK